MEKILEWGGGGGGMDLFYEWIIWKVVKHDLKLFPHKDFPPRRKVRYKFSNSHIVAAGRVISISADHFQ